jgi:hypothetical protein
MVNDILPVVFGAKDFNQNSIQVEELDTDHSKGDISDFYRTVKSSDVVKKKYQGAKRRSKLNELL